MHVVFWASVAVLAWVYLGYPSLVRLLARGRTGWRAAPASAGPRTAVLLACHDEEARIGPRIRDVRSQGGWSPGMRLMVVADRCTDGTVAAAEGEGGVEVLEIRQGPGGRAAAHNAALAILDVDVVVFTDADTRFAPDFLDHILAPFGDPRVGCVVGSLEYRAQGSEIAATERAYFSWEKRLREAESALGLLATGTGACMAVRASLFRPLGPTHDVDFVTPLDVVFQGFRVVTAPQAVAYDTPPLTALGEWRVRIRQTSRNLSGTVERWWTGGGWRYPGVTLGLLSHKVLRWMTGLFLIAALVSAWGLWDAGLVYRGAALGQGAAWVVGLAALALSSLGGVRLGILTRGGAFLWASLAMLVGCWVALRGRAQVTYKPAEAATP